MTTPFTIAVDAMGGDNAPASNVEGALLAAARYPDIRLILIGREAELRAELAKHEVSPVISIRHASEVIDAADTPTTAVRRKKDSSLVVGLNAVKNKEADAFISAGNTGALLTGATVIVGRSEGIERPALGTLLPNTDGFTFLIDSGANVDAKPSYLLQFAKMGSDYMRRVMRVETPRVALINVGAEKEKGSALVKEAYALLEQAEDIHFIGNVEARDIPLGAADVAVCDAFVGNVVLKYTEGFANAMMSLIKTELTAGFMSKIGALMAKGAFKRIKKRFDYKEIGGAPFLGLNALVVKAHGSSDGKAIFGAVRQCIIYNEPD